MSEPGRRVGMHALVADDEPAFQALLRAVYGETYSYAFLYEPGGMASLLEAGATLWGDFDGRGELVGHTGIFFKNDGGADFAESGMSFRRPKALPTTADAVAFDRILADAAARVPYLHQNTSTWHPLAQRFAERHMGATPTGLVFEYVEPHERIVGLPAAEAPMDALTMTTCLRPDISAAPALVPEGPFAAWLVERFAPLGVEAEVVERADGLTHAFLPFDPVACLGLVRSLVVDSACDHALSAPPEDRTTLVHLPTDRRVHALSALEERGFLPVGVRPRQNAPHEIVLQKLSTEARDRALRSLLRASLTPAARTVAHSWRAVCARLT